MNETRARTAGPEEPAVVTKPPPETDSLEQFMMQIEERASTQTEVLIEVLHQNETAQWRHWGINE